MIGSFRILFPSARRHGRNLIIALLAGAAAQATGIALPLIARRLVNRVSSQATGSGVIEPRLVWIIAGAFLGLALLRGGLRWLQGLRGEYFAQAVLADARFSMYAHLQKLSGGYFDHRPGGKILVRFIGDSNALKSWLARTLISTPSDLLMISIVMIVLGGINMQLLIAAIVPLILLVPVLAWINPHARRWTREGRKQQTRLCGLLNDHLETMNLIKAGNTQSVEAGGARRLIDQIAAANIGRARLDAWSQALSIITATCAMAGVVIWSSILFVSGSLNHGDVLAAVWLTLLMRGPVNRLARANVMHQRARVAVDRIRALLERKPERGWAGDLKPYVGAGRLIELKHVGFRTSPTHWVVRELSLTLQGPALCALSDDPGGPGSTVFQLLQRLRRPHEGRIYFDGQDARRVRVDQLRERIGWVDRHRKVLDVTARVTEKLSDEAWFASAWSRTAALASDVAPTDPPAWPEESAALTEEVRFRLAVTCALRQDPPILLIENPTAGLEAQAADRVLAWLGAIAREKLVVVTSNDRRVLAAASFVASSYCADEDASAGEPSPCDSGTATGEHAFPRIAKPSKGAAVI